jgi:predicted GIY-YIG superfamily endonuclease
MYPQRVNSPNYIYVIYHNADVIYVGCSINPVKSRWPHHIKRAIEWKFSKEGLRIDILAFSRDRKKALWLESQMIARFRPVLNGTW